MPQCIISMSPSQMGDSFDSFLHQINSPEPCSLSWEDFIFPHAEDFQNKLRYCSGPVVTDEPMRWASILFEHEDVVEFRPIPPRDVKEKMLPRIFMKATTTRHHGIYPWTSANEVDVFVNKLQQLNQGGATWWGLRVCKSSLRPMSHWD